MIVDIATEERVPVNKLENMALSELGLLIVNECIDGDIDYAYNTLLDKYVELSVNPDNHLQGMDLKEWGLIRVDVNPLGFTRRNARKIPQLDYVFQKSVITNHPSVRNPAFEYQPINFIGMLREVFLIQGGLRCDDYTDKNYVDSNDELHVLLDFMEYKCNEVYKKYGGLCAVNMEKDSYDIQ